MDGFGVIILLSRSGFEADKLDDFKGLNDHSVLQTVIGAGLTWLAVVIFLYHQCLYITCASNSCTLTRQEIHTPLKPARI